MRRSPLRQRSNTDRAKREEVADVLWSKRVKQRAGHRCERCGGWWGLDAAHIIGRRAHCIRWNPENGICLCRADHDYFGGHPAEWWRWLEAKFPGRVEALRLIEARRPRVDIEAVIEQLRRAA